MSINTKKTFKILGCFITTVYTYNKNEYWTIQLKDTEANRTLIRERLWKSKTPNYNNFQVNVTHNQKYLLITFPNEKIYTFSIESINKTEPNRVKQMLDEKESNATHRKAKKKLLALLEEHGFKFEIDFAYYREDSDYMIVHYKGEHILDGTTHDLVE